MIKGILRATVLLPLITSLVFPQHQAGGGIVYGDEIAVLVSAPNGWVLDNISGRSQGLHAVFYPVDSSWSKSDAVMYVDIAKLANGQNIMQFIEDDVQRFRKRFSNLNVEAQSNLFTLNAQKVEVRHFTGDEWGNHECVGYAKYKRSVAIYVLSARNAREFKAALPAFNKLITESVLSEVKFKEKN